MECAMCHAKVDDFTLSKASLDGGVSFNTESKLQRIIEEYSEIEDFDSGIGLLPSAFSGLKTDDVGLFDDDDDFMARAQGASTPVKAIRSPIASGVTCERVVLRIDNVPWVGTLSAAVTTQLTCRLMIPGYHTSCNRKVVEVPCGTRACITRS